jgi:hypothetical protein
MRSIRLHYNKSSKEKLLKYGGDYKGFASIYRFYPYLNKSVLIEKISSEFISGDKKDAMYHFESIVKDYSKNFEDKSQKFPNLLSHQIDKIVVTRESVLEK